MTELRSNRRVSRERILVLAGVIALLFIVYLGYLFSLQIIDGYIYAMRAEQVTRRSTVIPAPRGQIFDRNYDSPLVTNVDSFAIEINPASIPRDSHEELFERIADALDISVSRIHQRIPARRYNVYQWVEIDTAVPFEIVAYLAENTERYPGVRWRNSPVRQYTMANSLAHTLGYVGQITTEELQVLYNRGYTANSLLGKAGIEQQYDEMLRGEQGRRFLKVDARGREVGEGELEPIIPELGENLVLTIDRRIQELAERTLGKRTGSVVALRPHSGEILAMASYPYYDPNIFFERGRTESFQSLSIDARAPFLNRVIQSAAVPASTFKMIMTAAVLEEEAFPLDQPVTCRGSLRFGNRTFNCWMEYGHGPLTLFDGLAQSCNVFFYTMGGDHLGEEVIIDYAKQFGFGERTGIDLPGEVPGLVPTPEWKQARFGSRWVGGDTVNLSIGQGFIEVTPLQLANALAMVVNNGVIYRPHVLREVRDQETGQIIHRVEPEVLRTADISAETFVQLRKALRRAVAEGTARPVITTRAVDIAGKTGTGETGRPDELHSWFVSYGPYDAGDPKDKVVLAVMVDGSNEWEWWAPRASNVIMHGIFTGESYEESLHSLGLSWWLRAEQEQEEPEVPEEEYQQQHESFELES